MSTKQARAQAPSKEPGRKEKQSPGKIGENSLAHRDEAVATVLSRDAFSRERFEFLLRTIFVLFALLALSLAANVFYGMRETKFRYFAVDTEGSVKEIVALDRPVQSHTQVRSWSTDAIVSSLTFSFANYQQQLGDARLSFTDSGWRSFERALQASGILNQIIKEQMITSVVPAGAPVIRSQGVADNGRYGWQIELPIMVTYESTSHKQSTGYTVQATIVRRPESENPSGLGIAQLIVR